LHELWALLNFLLPKLFDSAAEFDALFTVDAKTGTRVIGISLRV
jgi:SNF2 family DNA or RNA helicase